MITLPEKYNENNIKKIDSDIKVASVYNTAIDDSLYEIKNAVYPHYKAFFIWDKTC